MPILLTLAVAVAQVPGGGSEVIPSDSHLKVPVGGLEQSAARAQTFAVSGRPFTQALRVTIGKATTETNATQLTIPNSDRVEVGDNMLASFWVKGAAADGRSPGRIEFLFEKATDPWTKSATQAVSTGKAWRRVFVPIHAAEAYAPGESMVSLRFAFGPQTVEVGGLTVTNFRRSRDLDELRNLAIAADPLGSVRVAINLKQGRQTLQGMGGNFCQPRYGATEPLDAVGRYVLDNLKVVHARIGIPLNNWAPQPGVYRDDAQARASLLALQELSRRRIPTVASVWEGPQWMIGGRPEQGGRVLPRERYRDCIEAIAQYLVTARDKYGATVDYFSFNEADYGVNFKFSSREIADFIRQAVPRFAALKLKTKFLVGDTANGASFYDYARPLLEDASIARYLGPLAFHSWDALSVPDEAYRRIATLGRRYRKPVWCLEAGHDPGLWRAQDPWGTWENGLRTAQAYVRTLGLTETSLIDYWTYQDNYPLVDKQGPRPYPVFHVMRQMQDVLVPGAKVVGAKADREDLQVLATTKGRSFAVLLVNPVGAGQVRLTGLPPGRSVRVVVSDRNRQGVSDRMARRVSAQGDLTVRVPLRSVVSVLGG